MTLQTLRRFTLVPVLVGSIAALGLSGCINVPAVDSSAAIVVPQPATKRDVAHAQALREMRVRAAAAETGPYPDVFAVATPDIANPPPVSEVAATADHLTRLGRRQQASSSPAQIAAGQARALQLRRLGKLRAAQAEQTIRDASKKQ